LQIQLRNFRIQRFLILTITTMRKFALLLTIGLFLSATTANASDGGKAAKTTGKKAHCTCSHKTATAAKGCCPGGATAKCPKGSCAKHASATGTTNSSSTTAPKTAAAKS
jgi:hypothetical protein